MITLSTMASDMFYGASAHLFEQAKKLRQSMTTAETTLWNRLRANQLNGYRFKAQHPIAFFVADFYNHAARLVIELDGGIHDSEEQREYDANRTYLLEAFGITVIRFRNEDVFNDIDTVLIKLVDVLNQLTLPPGLTPGPATATPPTGTPPTPRHPQPPKGRSAAAGLWSRMRELLPL